MSFNGEIMTSFSALSIGLLMNICTIPISTISMSVAEEKEKMTLRSLMLANISAFSFLFSKLLFVYILSETISLVIYIITKVDLMFSWYFFVTTLTCFCIMTIGAIVGLLCKNQISASVVYTPIMMLMLIPTAFVTANQSMENVARFLPTYALTSLLFYDNIAHNLAVIIVWFIIGVTVFLYVYPKIRNE
jgi:ABC-2 type transport system permease protein